MKYDTRVSNVNSSRIYAGMNFHLNLSYYFQRVSFGSYIIKMFICANYLICKNRYAGNNFWYTDIMNILFIK